MDALVNSLSESFRRLPPASIPAMLDCILVSTGSSPSSLLSSLLNTFPQLTKDIVKGSKELEPEECNYVGAFVAALCHLLKKSGANLGDLRQFVWKILLPLMKLAHAYNREVFNEVERLFLDVVVEVNNWVVVEEILVPFFLRLIGLSMGMLQSGQIAIYNWSACLDSVEYDDQLSDFDFIQISCAKPGDSAKNKGPVLTQSFPLPVSCHILTSILDAAVQCKLTVGRTSELFFSNGCSADVFAGNLLWDLLSITVQMLSHSPEHRSYAISILLPSVFKVFGSCNAFEVPVHEQIHILSGKHVLMNLWKCCTTLFCLGPLERRDAYAMLSLYLSFFSCTNGYEDDDDMGGRGKAFDLTAQMIFWDEIKRGLVDRETMVRKQALHILKMVVHIREINPGITKPVSKGKSSVPHAMTKRGQWAHKEAESLGVAKICNSIDPCLNRQQRWRAFFLLYEMLEEYGTHLVEAAWNHQMNLLLYSSLAFDNPINSVSGDLYANQMETLKEILKWLAILWERGFYHDNPQVRCLIMQSFLAIEWKNYGSCAKLLPDDFVLGPFIHALNDPVHSKDFGVKGAYSSKTIEGAAKFLCQYSSCLTRRERIVFLSNLASFAKKHSLGRAGLMGLAKCIASAACGDQVCDCHEVNWREDGSPETVTEKSSTEGSSTNNKSDLLDNLRFVIESGKQHFNPNYRLQVCERVLDAAASVMCALDVPRDMLLHFISAVPREFIDRGGFLKGKLQKWLLACEEKQCPFSCCSSGQLLKSLNDFPSEFVCCHHSMGTPIAYDDEDLEAWRSDTERWARVLFVVIMDDQHFNPMLTFLQNYGSDICKENIQCNWVPVKFLVLVLSLVQELEVIRERTADFGMKGRNKLNLGRPEIVGHISCIKASAMFEKLSKLFLSILEELVSFSGVSCSVFWLNIENMVLPVSIKGKLGGPSQRRLSSSVTTTILQAIISVRTVASIVRWCAHFGCDFVPNSALKFLWKLSWEIIASRTWKVEHEAEIRLASFEALAYALKTLVSTFSPSSLDFLTEHDKLPLPVIDGRSLCDTFVLTFLKNINDLISVGNLARTRRAILMDWKWICLEHMLSIPNHALQNGVDMDTCSCFFSDSTLRCIFGDLVESLENAGEGSVLPMLRSIRLILELFVSGRMTLDSSYGIDAQMMWQLVHSSWILHTSCNKRRVAPIAALLSSVLHYSIFRNESMHEIDNAPGPLKWFVEKILEEGTKSPRTIRLAALHLTGLWLENPHTIKYYMKELKLLTMYGSVAFDEDFEAELADNYDTRIEVSLLAKSPDPELTEEFINTELYARVSVAVLFYKLADMANMMKVMSENESSSVALESGKMFLLELLDSVVNDKDLSKELYKKYSAIHRRKIRAWQQICVLALFVDEDVVGRVTSYLQISLYRNNLPGVRQYLETFAIHIYLKFPSLVVEQLVPLLRDYNLRPQALSSYVFIAANVILHASQTIQSSHLYQLLPPIIPLLTSHHHTLRGFTQLLVYQVLGKVLPLNSCTTGSISLEKRCFMDLKSYLANNTDCARLRASMEGYLDNFDPKNSISPAGIFTNRVEDLEFECVPTSLTEQVIIFLNAAREDLRCSMAKDAEKIKNESLRIDESPRKMETSVDSNKQESLSLLPEDLSLDFQRKFTFSVHERQDTDSGFFLGNKDTYRSLMDMEKEDRLFDQLLHSRSVAMEELRASRQEFILVASLIDRVPNLAGLARTCEVFKAAGLAIADKSILNDKQFQLISVTAEKWVPIIEVPTGSVKFFLEKKKQEGFAILGLEQTANSIPLDQYSFPKKTVLVLGREKEGIPVEIIHILDACIEIPQLGVVRSLNVHVSGAIALWEYTRQQRS